MYLLHRKKIDIYANINLFLSYSGVTVAIRSGTYPAQMITAVNRSSPYPDHMVDHHLETTSTALNVSRERPRWAPETDLQWGPRHLDIHRENTIWNQWSPYNLMLLQLEQTTGSSGQRGTGPPTEPGFSQGFFTVLSPMEFWFLAVVASGLLSWGHLISSDITNLIAQILFKLNWAGWWHHWIQ